MKNRFLHILFIVLFISTNVFAVIDSVGTEVVNGKKIILHKVEAKETLYSISKKYSVKTDEITTANPGSEVGISVGQILKIPTQISSEGSQSSQTNNTPSDDSAKKSYHTVKPGETLYAISTLYPCSVDDIKKWNNLTSNALTVGQKIIVGIEVTNDEVTEQVASSEEIDNTPVDDNESESSPYEEVEEEVETPSEEETEEEPELVSAEDNSSEEEIETSEEENEEVESSNDTPSEKEEAKEEKKIPNDRPIDIDIQIKTKEQIDAEYTAKMLQDTTANDTLPSKRTVDMDGYIKEFQKGYAILMKGTSTDERYLAHHRTLPEGTILQVKNLENGKNVFVRVVGVLEHEDPKVIISLSSKAETRLNSANSTFLTEISYIP